MKIISARQAWHDCYYQPWDSVMSVAAEWARLGAAVQTTEREFNCAHAAHQAIAGRIQAAISTLPEFLQCFGHHMYSPIGTESDQRVAEASVFALAVGRFPSMRQARHQVAEYVAKGVVHRYRRMNQGGQDGGSDVLARPEAFRAWVADQYSVSLSSQNWDRNWGGFVEACFGACNDLDRAALKPVSMALDSLMGRT